MGRLYKSYVINLADFSITKLKSFKSTKQNYAKSTDFLTCLPLVKMEMWDKKQYLDYSFDTSYSSKNYFNKIQLSGCDQGMF